MDHKQAMELLRTTLIHDVKKLAKWRETLRKEMLEQRKDIQMSKPNHKSGRSRKSKNVEADKVEVILTDGVEALNMNWDVLAKAGDTIYMKWKTITIKCRRSSGD